MLKFTTLVTKYSKKRKLSYNYFQSFSIDRTQAQSYVNVLLHTGSFNYLLIWHFSFGSRGTPDMHMQNLATLSEKLFRFVFSLLVSLLRVLVLSKRALSF